LLSQTRLDSTQLIFSSLIDYFEAMAENSKRHYAQNKTEGLALIRSNGHCRGSSLQLICKCQHMTNQNCAITSLAKAIFSCRLGELTSVISLIRRYNLSTPLVKCLSQFWRIICILVELDKDKTCPWSLARLCCGILTELAG